MLGRCPSEKPFIPDNKFSHLNCVIIRIQFGPGPARIHSHAPFPQGLVTGVIPIEASMTQRGYLRYLKREAKHAEYHAKGLNGDRAVARRMRQRLKRDVKDRTDLPA